MLALLTFLTVGFFVAMITVAPELSLSSKTCANQLYHSGQSEKIRIVKVLANSSLEHQFWSLAVCFVSHMEPSSIAAVGQQRIDLFVTFPQKQVQHGSKPGWIQGGKWNHRAAMLTLRLLRKLCLYPFFPLLVVTEFYQLTLKFPRFDLLPKSEVGLSLFLREIFFPLSKSGSAIFLFVYLFTKENVETIPTSARVFAIAFWTAQQPNQQGVKKFIFGIKTSS